MGGYPKGLMADLLLDQTENIYCCSHGQGLSHPQWTWSYHVFQLKWWLTSHLTRQRTSIVVRMGGVQAIPIRLDKIAVPIEEGVAIGL